MYEDVIINTWKSLHLFMQTKLHLIKVMNQKVIVSSLLII